MYIYIYTCISISIYFFFLKLFGPGVSRPQLGRRAQARAVEHEAWPQASNPRDDFTPKKCGK